nr:hypothetical protein BaRGS_031714 [Batillaria attramentaria]
MIEPEQSSDKFDDDMSRLKVEIDLIHSENRRLQEDIRKMKESNKHLELEILGLEERNKELRQSIEASEKELQDLQHKMQLGGGAVESGAEPEVEQRADDIPVFSVFGPPLDGLEVKPDFEGKLASTVTDQAAQQDLMDFLFGKKEGKKEKEVDYDTENHTMKVEIARLKSENQQVKEEIVKTKRNNKTLENDIKLLKEREKEIRWYLMDRT